MGHSDQSSFNLLMGKFFLRNRLSILLHCSARDDDWLAVQSEVDHKRWREGAGERGLFGNGHFMFRRVEAAASTREWTVVVLVLGARNTGCGNADRTDKPSPGDSGGQS